MIKQGSTQDSSEGSVLDPAPLPGSEAGPADRVGRGRRLAAIGGWAVLLVALIVALAGTLAATRRAYVTHSIVTASGQAALDILSRPMPRGASADAYEAYSELVLAADPLAIDLAALASEQVLERASDRPFVWARLAYSLSQSATDGGPLPARAVEALARSMELCAVCSADLVRWRLNFVLAHWRSIPDSLRRQAVVMGSRLTPIVRRRLVRSPDSGRCLIPLRPWPLVRRHAGSVTMIAGTSGEERENHGGH